MSPDKSRTLKNLATAIACESCACLRHQHLAKIAAVAGYDGISQALRLAVTSGIERTHSALDFLWEIDRPPLGIALASMSGEAHSTFRQNIARYERRYLQMARAARDEGLGEIAQWFEMAATVEHSRVELLRRMLARPD